MSSTVELAEQGETRLRTLIALHLGSLEMSCQVTRVGIYKSGLQ